MSRTPTSRASDTCADLQLVVPAQDQVDRIDEHLREQRAGGQLAHVDPAPQDEHAADHQHRAERSARSVTLMTGKSTERSHSV